MDCKFAVLESIRERCCREGTKRCCREKVQKNAAENGTKRCCRGYKKVKGAAQDKKKKGTAQDTKWCCREGYKHFLEPNMKIRRMECKFAVLGRVRERALKGKALKRETARRRCGGRWK